MPDIYTFALQSTFFLVALIALLLVHRCHRRTLSQRDAELQRLQAMTAELELKSLAIESAGEGIGILDRAGRIVFANRTLADLHGVGAHSLLGQSWRELYRPEDISRLERDLTTALARETTIRAEAHGLRPDGSTFPAEVSFRAIERGGIVAIARDISARKEDALEAERLAAFALYSPAPVIRFDGAGRIIFANPSAGEIFGLSSGQATYLRSVIEAVGRFDLAACIAHGEILTCSAVIGGRHYHFVLRGLPTHGFGHAYGSDVTELKRAHQKLIESRKFLRKVIDANPNFIFVKDARGRFTLGNKAVADAFGTTVGALVGKTLSDFSHTSEEAGRVLTEDRTIIERLEHRLIGEERVTMVTGETRWVQTVKKPIVMNRTGEVRILAVSTDITEQKQLQDQLLQSQKMEAIGQLAGGISHDFNNLLTGILGYTALLKMTTERHPDIYKTIELIENTAHRAAALTQKLLGFARKGKHRNIPVNLHTTIDETMAILQRTIEQNITLKLLCDAPNAFVLGDPVQLQQVILNLAINARDAMTAHVGGADGGEMTLTTRCLESPGATGLSSTDSRSPGYLEVTVRDTGCGIPLDIQKRIFEPFFTTKEPDRGSGMGLAMVYGIVANHGGTVTVRSTPGEGAEFRVVLPLSPTTPAQLPTVLPTRPLSGEGSVLVVDDHPVVRQVTARMLDALGYRVTTAHDGVEALEYYREHVSDIDLVIIDMVMPRMGARECFRKLKALDPNVVAILSTGYVQNDSVQEIMTDGMSAFIQKPYQLGQLAAVVEQVMRGRPRKECRAPAKPAGIDAIPSAEHPLHS
jgi:PAS domain S-box-containing protein